MLQKSARTSDTNTRTSAWGIAGESALNRLEFNYRGLVTTPTYHNDEIGMTNDELNPNDESRNGAEITACFFVIRASTLSRGFIHVY